jgi:amidase
MMPTVSDPMMLGAVQLAAQIRNGKISAREATEASLARIGRLDGQLRSFITVDAESALATADACDQLRQKGGNLPPLLGLPVGIKDVTATAGLRTTSGSRLRAQNIPEKDEESVARLRRAGAIIVGKTNTPEFAFGAVCTNALCGPTGNPWNTDLTTAGSSGGSAAAVTAGLVPLAQGTDFGGSVRTPASFCGCVGLRPTPGTIPEPARALAFDNLATQGVLARTVDDAALMLGAMAGPHLLDPTSARPDWPGHDTQEPLRVAASATLGGAFQIDADVRACFERAVTEAKAAFGTITRAHPDATGASAAFKTLRAAASWVKFGAMVEAHEDTLTPSFVWNVRQGRLISAEAMLHAEIARSRTWRAFRTFFDDHDILILPAGSVLPFPNAQGEVTQVGGQPCETIIDYLACTYIISLIGFPALALPALWTDDGRPFGIQLIARPHHEATLLRAGRMLEAAGFSHRWPPICGVT